MMIAGDAQAALRDVSLDERGRAAAEENLHLAAAHLDEGPAKPAVAVGGEKKRMAVAGVKNRAADFSVADVEAGGGVRGEVDDAPDVQLVAARIMRERGEMMIAVILVWKMAVGRAG